MERFNEWVNRCLDRLGETRVGRWAEQFGAPPWWAAPVLGILSVVLSTISILLSAGVFAR